MRIRLRVVRAQLLRQKTGKRGRLVGPEVIVGQNTKWRGRSAPRRPNSTGGSEVGYTSNAHHRRPNPDYTIDLKSGMPFDSPLCKTP